MGDLKLNLNLDINDEEVERSIKEAVNDYITKNIDTLISDRVDELVSQKIEDRVAIDIAGQINRLMFNNPGMMFPSQMPEDPALQAIFESGNG